MDGAGVSFPPPSLPLFSSGPAHRSGSSVTSPGNLRAPPARVFGLIKRRLSRVEDDEASVGRVSSTHRGCLWLRHGDARPAPAPPIEERRSIIVSLNKSTAMEQMSAMAAVGQGSRGTWKTDHWPPTWRRPIG